jgi:MoaA/NifB/PqqE/SkfB family radical SAM enzyme
MFAKHLHQSNQLFLELKIFSRIVPPKRYFGLFSVFAKRCLRLYAPFSAVVALTYRCQCKCIHCSAGLYKKEKKSELSMREWSHLLNDIHRLGVPRINITGGEALLRDDIFEIIQYAAERFVVILETNGQLLNRKNVGLLKKAKLSCVAVSIDDFDPAVHDSLRNLKGCFQNAIEGISLAKERGIPCILSTYVNSAKANRSYIDKIAALGRQLEVMAVRILPARPVGSFFCHAAQEHNLLGYIDSRLCYFKGLPAPKKCGVFTKATFYVSPYGEIQLCPYLPFSFGNIKEADLRQILMKLWSHNIFQEQSKDCFVLNTAFRDKMITPHLGTLEKGAVFPIEV